MKEHLIISEDFYSIQGEGATAGKPAVFLRLAACNLQCEGFSYRDPLSGERLGCDTKHVWRKGLRKSFSDITQAWNENKWLDALNNGAHLVITGGEPLIQQDALIDFIHYLDSLLETPPFIEIETNATILFDFALLQRINQINASPKLKNSSEPREKAYRHDVLSQLVCSNKTRFKFVIMQPSDIEEVMEHYVREFTIHPHSIWLMPEGGTAHDIQQKSLWIVNLCKDYGMNYSPRLQITIWDEVTGV